MIALHEGQFSGLRRYKIFHRNVHLPWVSFPGQLSHIRCSLDLFNPRNSSSFLLTQTWQWICSPWGGNVFIRWWSSRRCEGGTARLVSGIGHVRGIWARGTQGTRSFVFSRGAFVHGWLVQGYIFPGGEIQGHRFRSLRVKWCRRGRWPSLWTEYEFTRISHEYGISRRPTFWLFPSPCAVSWLVNVWN